MPINTSHVIGSVGAGGALTDALVYLTHWPWQPMDATSAAPFATLILMVAAPFMAKLYNKVGVAAQALQPKADAPAPAQPQA